MNNIEKAIAFSNGEWRTTKELAKHLGDSRPSNTLKSLQNKNGVTYEADHNEYGKTIRYRASFIESFSPVDIAKSRKARGLPFGLESISILGGAA